MLTEVKRRLGRGDVEGGAPLRLPEGRRGPRTRVRRATFPEGFSHEEILDAPVQRGDGADGRVLRPAVPLYAPVRFGGRAPTGGSDVVLELVQSLYAAEPMWRLYVTPYSPEPATTTSPGTSAPTPERAGEEG